MCIKACQRCRRCDIYQQKIKGNIKLSNFTHVGDVEDMKGYVEGLSYTEMFLYRDEQHVQPFVQRNKMFLFQVVTSVNRYLGMGQN